METWQLYLCFTLTHRTGSIQLLYTVTQTDVSIRVSSTLTPKSKIPQRNPNRLPFTRLHFPENAKTNNPIIPTPPGRKYKDCWTPTAPITAVSDFFPKTPKQRNPITSTPPTRPPQQLQATKAETRGLRTCNTGGMTGGLPGVASQTTDRPRPRRKQRSVSKTGASFAHPWRPPSDVSAIKELFGARYERSACFMGEQRR